MCKIYIDEFTREISTSEGQALLTPTEYNIVKLLAPHHPVPVLRKNILKTIWKRKMTKTKSFAVHLNSLRIKLKPLKISVEYLGFLKSYRMISEAEDP